MKPTAEAQKRHYQRHKRLGICVSCTEPATDGIYCRRHHNIRIEAQTRKNQAFYAKKKANGLCAYCREPATDGVVCARHRAYLRSPRRKKS